MEDERKKMDEERKKIDPERKELEEKKDSDEKKKLDGKEKSNEKIKLDEENKKIEAEKKKIEEEKMKLEAGKQTLEEEMEISPYKAVVESEDLQSVNGAERDDEEAKPTEKIIDMSDDDFIDMMTPEVEIQEPKGNNPLTESDEELKRGSDDEELGEISEAEGSSNENKSKSEKRRPRLSDSSS